MSYIGNPIVSQAFLTDQFSGNGSTTAFILSVAPANSASILVAVSGVLQDPTTYGVAGTTLTFSAAPPAGTANISVRYLGIPSTGVTSTAYRTVSEITATAGQTTFTIPSYTVGFLNVFQNGNLLGSADYTATTGTTVVLATGATVGDLLTFESFSVSSVLNAIPASPGAVVPAYLAAAGASRAFLDVVNSNGTGALRIPQGTTAQRPASPQAGDTRYNTTTNQTEIYSGTGWTGITTQSYTATYLLIAGGGGGGSNAYGGGGGAGGLLSGTATVVAGTTYSFTVGAGGAGGSTSPGTSGNNSTGFTLTAIGGGGGAGNANIPGLSGGSGGGGDGVYNSTGGSGTSGQGNSGGNGNNGTAGGGGGGAGAAGSNGSGNVGGSGGVGLQSSITGTATYYAGGGGAFGTSGLGSGGLGGGGASNVAGAANTGGGGGADNGSGGKAGGSGVLIVSVPTTYYTGVTTGSPSVTTSGSNTILTFTSSGSYTA